MTSKWKTIEFGVDLVFTKEQKRTSLKESFTFLGEASMVEHPTSMNRDEAFAEGHNIAKMVTSSQWGF